MPKSDRSVAPRLDRQRAVDQLVAAAITLLAEKGPTEIKARSVAEAAGLSTIAVYHHLGGLPELFKAVVDQGFLSLGETFLAAPATDDPVTSLFGMALAARHFANSNPHLYDLMFGLSTRGSYRPLNSASEGRTDNFQRAYIHLVHSCVRLVASGRVRADEKPEVIALQLWSVCHGFITLELGGHVAQFDDPVGEVLQPLMVNILIGLGDDRQSADASHAAGIAAARELYASDPGMVAPIGKTSATASHSGRPE